jgi:hypothetical protein
MKVLQSPQIPARLTVVVALAQLLQRLEGSTVPVDPAQYRAVAGKLAEALREAPADDALQAVLGAFPAASDVYENLHYAHAGLCRAPLEFALQAELKARELLAKAGRAAH